MAINDDPQMPTDIEIFMRGASTQMRVIGALVIRELHTRFGRDNVGFLWVIIEPIMLSLGVAALHSTGGLFIHFGMPIGSYIVSGYTCYILFRAVVNRAGGAIEANKTLLYHRIVTIFDILTARALLEAASTVLAVVVLSSLMELFDYGTLPQRPLLMMAGLGWLLWFAFGLSLVVAAYSEKSSTVERLTHPLMYLSMPLSGVFLLLQFIPDPYRYYLSFVPTTSMFELIREGQFDFYDSDYIYPVYCLGWCLFLTCTGLIVIRSVRRELHLG